ncbi:helix-turn-helix domain-containing protein [Trueperella pyogenes]|uniref:helix-turn-helix domain-containing protein n=1 Tax=Trueperella pyogenes TaxID=1661 RepID=UPI003133024E
MTNKATTEVVSALANPVRLTILYEIAAVGTARTSDIAHALDMAANKVSYHLKRLESAGVIRKEPGTDARETWWSAVPGGWEVNEPELTPGFTAALSALHQHVRERAVAFADERRRRGITLPFAHADSVLTLQLGDAHNFADELGALFDKYTQLSDAHKGEARTGAGGRAKKAANDGATGDGVVQDLYRYDFQFSLQPIGDA